MSENEKTVINGVEIVTDGDTTHFTIHDDETEKKETEKESGGFFSRIWNWLKKHDVKPYVKIRDLADPFKDRTDYDAGSDGKTGVEAGIKISF